MRESYLKKVSRRLVAPIRLSHFAHGTICLYGRVGQAVERNWDAEIDVCPRILGISWRIPVFHDETVPGRC